MLKKVGIVYQAHRAESVALMEQTRDQLRAHQVSVWSGSTRDEDSLRQVAPDLDLLITLGGDGTIVQAIRTVAVLPLPILGVNLGRLGFLAEVEPADVGGALIGLLEGHYHVEQRMMLCCTVQHEGREILRTDAVNDVFVGRGLTSRMVDVSVDVDGHHVMTQTADGVIVATPTGSTAYCLSAGGPIVAPDAECITITPVAAHLSIAHSFVMPAHRTLTLGLEEGDGAMCTVDGQVDIPLVPGDRVCSVASQHTAKFVRFGGEGSFYDTVLRRLRWPDRTRLL